MENQNDVVRLFEDQDINEVFTALMRLGRFSWSDVWDSEYYNLNSKIALFGETSSERDHLLIGVPEATLCSLIKEAIQHGKSRVVTKTNVYDERGTILDRESWASYDSSQHTHERYMAELMLELELNKRPEEKDMYYKWQPSLKYEMKRIDRGQVLVVETKYEILKNDLGVGELYEVPLSARWEPKP